MRNFKQNMDVEDGLTEYLPQDDTPGGEERQGGFGCRREGRWRGLPFGRSEVTSSPGSPKLSDYIPVRLANPQWSFCFQQMSLYLLKHLFDPLNTAGEVINVLKIL